MGMRPEAVIYYGIPYINDEERVWAKEKYGYCIDDWWKDIQDGSVSLPIEAFIYDQLEIIAVRNKVISTYGDGEFKSFYPDSFIITVEERKILIEFCKKYTKKIMLEPKWYLLSVLS